MCEAPRCAVKILNGQEKENVLQLYLLVCSCYLFLPEILVENMDII